MNISIRWCGFDFGETIADTSKFYEGTVETIKEVYAELRKTDVINEKLRHLDKLLAKCGYDERLIDGIEGAREIELWKTNCRLKRLLETDIQKFFSYILDNDRDAVELYRRRRFRHFKPADGLKECLVYLKGKGISVNVVSDIESERSLRAVIQQFLSFFDLAPYFSDIITNYGRLKESGEIDLSYRGLKKTDGTIYKKLAQDLFHMGIQPSQALIIGDRPVEDVEKAKENGFKAIQFTGIIKRRISDAADYVISDLRELRCV